MEKQSLYLTLRLHFTAPILAILIALCVLNGILLIRGNANFELTQVKTSCENGTLLWKGNFKNLLDEIWITQKKCGCHSSFSLPLPHDKVKLVLKNGKWTIWTHGFPYDMIEFVERMLGIILCLSFFLLFIDHLLISFGSKTILRFIVDFMICCDVLIYGLALFHTVEIFTRIQSVQVQKVNHVYSVYETIQVLTLKNGNHLFTFKEEKCGWHQSFSPTLYPNDSIYLFWNGDEWTRENQSFFLFYDELELLRWGFEVSVVICHLVCLSVYIVLKLFCDLKPPYPISRNILEVPL